MSLIVKILLAWLKASVFTNSDTLSDEYGTKQEKKDKLINQLLNDYKSKLEASLRKWFLTNNRKG